MFSGYTRRHIRTSGLQTSQQALLSHSLTIRLATNALVFYSLVCAQSIQAMIVALLIWASMLGAMQRSANAFPPRNQLFRQPLNPKMNPIWNLHFSTPSESNMNQFLTNICVVNAFFPPSLYTCL